MTGLWLFIHFIGIIVWIGGMFFALHCLRPSLAQLPAPNRAPLMTAALGRFFNYVSVAIVLIWVSGLMMVASVGLKGAPLGWHVMIGAALIMTILFVLIRIWLFPQVLRAIAQEQLPVAAEGLNKIRWLVVVNLVLGLIAVGGVSLLR